MLGVILAFPEKRWENYTLPMNGEPIVRLTERRLLTAKRIHEVNTIVRKDKLKTYSLHVSKPIPVTARGKMEALLKALPDEPFFLVEGNMPLVMPFLVNYLVGLFYENEPEALIPVWNDGSAEVFHAVYEPDALRDAIESALAEGYKSFSRIAEFLDYEPVSIEELAKKNPKVTLSFFRVRSSMDVAFAEKTIEELRARGEPF
ncbi:molybdopterin-guanine dinucleotide biosynthesis protein MobA [Thermococcus eurythermalis]|uniref:Molybdopterin-guanine dinucleotide biosynthesis protein MobA n=1 Tax=Thermococcus eurythermalis TaxID=1505907 RepID=A0A097QUY4_9EURY|nr:molybdopterin-guanine dinucleotide biosynthesis protein MobA [Thermococcus eurythermalis]AIU70289.1 molybdopterin-guanine dinucleotide biosynthesis protein MobA [Thermococcus eurythermalis]